MDFTTPFAKRALAKDRKVLQALLHEAGYLSVCVPNRPKAANIPTYDLRFSKRGYFRIHFGIFNEPEPAIELQRALKLARFESGAKVQLRYTEPGEGRATGAYASPTRKQRELLPFDYDSDSDSDSE